MNTQQVEKLIRQTKRYEFQDGLRDIQLAIIFLTLGISFWFLFDRADVWLRTVMDWKHRLGDWAGWTVMIVALLPALLGLVVLPVMRRIRQRWLWRDSGMVRSKRWLVPRGVTVVSAIIGMLGLAIGIVLQLTATSGDFILLRILIVSSGWSLAYTLAAMGRKLDLPRYVWIGVGGGLVSTLLLFPALTVGQTGLIWGVLWGALLVVSGSGPLWKTLHTTQETNRDR